MVHALIFRLDRLFGSFPLENSTFYRPPLVLYQLDGIVSSELNVCGRDSRHGRCLWLQIWVLDVLDLDFWFSGCWDGWLNLVGCIVFAAQKGGRDSELGVRCDQ